MDFTEPRFTDEQAARSHLEAIRWPLGPVCPHCGGADRQSRLEGQAHRKGLLFCGHCRTQYSVTVGTVFERSKIALNKWVLATHLLCASKKGISSHQLHRMIGVTYKTAWFMTHRIREAFTTPDAGPVGGGGKIVEADETFWGTIKGRKPRGGRKGRGGGADHKHKILALVERDGRSKAFHIANVDHKTLKPILAAQISSDTHLMTDGAHHYKDIGKNFELHERVNHTQGQYAKKSKRPGIVAHTNTVESFFGIFKRGLMGTYHHVSEQHLQRYCEEFAFRHSYRTAVGVTDEQRAAIALKQIGGKRLTYRRVNAAS